MPKPALRLPRYAAPTLLFVAALHVLLAALLASLGVWRDRVPGTAAPPPLTVWLLRAFERAPAQVAPAISPSSPARPLRPSSPKPAAAVQAIMLPANPGSMAAEPAAPGAAPAVPGAATGSTAAVDTATPLNLALPRGASAPWRQRNPVLDDTRGRSARATFESMLADAMGGDGRWVEERIDNDRVRFRRGNTCVEMERSRSARIDSFNSSFSPKPWLAGKPSRC
jgi:hypothetical protein